MVKAKIVQPPAQEAADVKTRPPAWAPVAILIVGALCLALYALDVSKNHAVTIQSNIEQAQAKIAVDHKAIIDAEAAYKLAKDQEGFWRRYIFPDSADVKNLKAQIDSSTAKLTRDQQSLCLLQPECRKMQADNGSGHSLKFSTRAKVAGISWGMGILIVVVIVLFASGAGEIILIYIFGFLVVIGILELLWKTIEWVL